MPTSRMLRGAGERREPGLPPPKLSRVYVAVDESWCHYFNVADSKMRKPQLRPIIKEPSHASWSWQPSFEREMNSAIVRQPRTSEHYCKA
jgi:hypothetical protein